MGGCVPERWSPNSCLFAMEVSLKILAWNVRGLNSKFKRSLIFDYIKKYKPHLILLQETHLQGSRVLSLKRAHIAGAYHASYSSYARGVSTLVTKAMPISIHAVRTDIKGRYVILVVRVLNRFLTFVNLYVPPPFSLAHLDDMIRTTYEVAEGRIFILGDFNSVRLCSG